MELLAKKMRTLANNETAIVVTIREQVHKSLEATETGLFRILILVWPRVVRLEVLTVGESHIRSVEGDDEVLCIVRFLESVNNSWFLTHRPSEGFVRDTIAEAHALLVDDGHLRLFNGGWVIALEPQPSGTIQLK